MKHMPLPIPLLSPYIHGNKSQHKYNILDFCSFFCTYANFNDADNNFTLKNVGPVAKCLTSFNAYN